MHFRYFMKSIVLASMSSSRYQLLEKLGLPFTADAPNIDETPLINESATSLVTRLATEKAKSLAIKYPNHLIIGADQVGLLDHQIIGKPLTHTAAIKQLKQASGKKITFYTGLCLFDSETGKYKTKCELFTVYFRHLNDTEIENYLIKEQPYQCAGAFMSEGLGITLFEKLVGQDPNTLIGLPLISLINMLRAHGINPLS
ncbi:Maf-like protein YceF [Arsenophonus nasoniae]|uniref:Nucleoside triphosphate pyrophosphatase n=2 Tax=Arsenophonus nasoniae TaxID=638 RepID=D2TYR5_9GAMM|nr:Maf-like protein YceF [Arsenophonus nasoniae]CBA72590.1 Maf-like protein [Arsenophonus nasoniae]